jgi:hypothetical protein
MVFIDPPSAERFLAPARPTSPRSAARGAAARRVAAFAGPTFIASVAYLDPGNFALCHGLLSTGAGVWLGNQRDSHQPTR